MNYICEECKCKSCLLAMPHGDSQDCHHCDFCLDGEEQKDDCKYYKKS